jgi:phage terminase large subunit-like protein
MSPRRLHPAEQYARDVINGKIIAGRTMKQACKRYFDDLRHAKERGFEFRRDMAERSIKFCTKFIKHTKGREFVNRPFELEPWEQFILWNLFGWYRAKDKRWIVEINGRIEDTSGTRRFREVLIMIARKNGKTFLGAAICLYIAFADERPGGEPGAEVYIAATKLDQAKDLLFKDCQRQVKKSKALRDWGIVAGADAIYRESSGQVIVPLAADADTQAGLNVYLGFLDELYAHKTREMWDILETATGSRPQALIIGISTAGKNRAGICYEKYDYGKKVLEGIINDDTFLAIIFELDDGDDWRDESLWIKANPNLGVSKKFGDMRTKAERAKNMSSALNSFLQFELNVWVHGDRKWMPMDDWKACAGPIPALELEDYLKGRVCYTAMDLSSTSDIAGFIHYFPPIEGDPYYYTVCRFFIPEDNVYDRTKNSGFPYDGWAHDEYLIPTPGNVIDYDFIIEQLENDSQMFQIVQLSFDRWNAEFLIQQFENRGIGIPVVSFGQGYQSMSPALKEVERITRSHQLRHGGQPVLWWMADNMIIMQDPSGNIKPDKAKSKEKIDGMVMLCMAAQQARVNEGIDGSVYEGRGIVTF